MAVAASVRNARRETREAISGGAHAGGDAGEGVGERVDLGRGRHDPSDPAHEVWSRMPSLSMPVNTAFVISASPVTTSR